MTSDKFKVLVIVQNKLDSVAVSSLGHDTQKYFDFQHWLSSLERLGTYSGAGHVMLFYTIRTRAGPLP